MFSSNGLFEHHNLTIIKNLLRHKTFICLFQELKEEKLFVGLVDAKHVETLSTFYITIF